MLNIDSYIFDTFITFCKKRIGTTHLCPRHVQMNSRYHSRIFWRRKAIKLNALQWSSPINSPSTVNITMYLTSSSAIFLVLQRKSNYLSSLTPNWLLIVRRNLMRQFNLWIKVLVRTMSSKSIVCCCTNVMSFSQYAMRSNIMVTKVRYIQNLLFIWKIRLSSKLLFFQLLPIQHLYHYVVECLA